jgi:tetratricopeptide (TPR) repeat protein
LACKFKAWYESVVRLDRQFWDRAAKRIIHPLERQKSAQAAVAEAERLLKEDKGVEAEKKFIEALSLDRNCRSAYRGLGDFYMEAKNYVQAKETYAYLARLGVRECCGPGSDGRRGRNVGRRGHGAPAAGQSQIAKDHVNLAAACRALGDVACFRRAMEIAVAHEPANPRHLDLLLEACIMDGDREIAAKVLGVLKEVNPDNQKLPQMEEKVRAMGEKVAA